jgi:hypothetical protein
MADRFDQLRIAPSRWQIDSGLSMESFGPAATLHKADVSSPVTRAISPASVRAPRWPNRAEGPRGRRTPNRVYELGRGHLCDAIRMDVTTAMASAGSTGPGLMLPPSGTARIPS